MTQRPAILAGFLLVDQNLPFCYNIHIESKKELEMGYRVINVTPEFRAQFKHVMVWKALSSTMVIACCITAHVMASTLTLRQICF
jgi:hypothetical protein